MAEQCQMILGSHDKLSAETRALLSPMSHLFVSRMSSQAVAEGETSVSKHLAQVESRTGRLEASTSDVLGISSFEAQALAVVKRGLQTLPDNGWESGERTRVSNIVESREQYALATPSSITTDGGSISKYTGHALTRRRRADHVISGRVLERTTSVKRNFFGKLLLHTQTFDTRKLTTNIGNDRDPKDKRLVHLTFFTFHPASWVVRTLIQQGARGTFTSTLAVGNIPLNRTEPFQTIHLFLNFAKTEILTESDHSYQDEKHRLGTLIHLAGHPYM